MNSFEAKFGQNFLTSVPSSPGVYLIYDSNDCLTYVGKAKNLRRRLSQYKNAKRRKKHRKMKKIVAGAFRIQITSCETEEEAELLENRLIQEIHPKWNVSGAFYFLYPMIGLAVRPSSEFILCYTTQPHELEKLGLSIQFHGAYRSRAITRDTFFALNKLLSYIGHRSPKSQVKDLVPNYSYLYRFRLLPEEVHAYLPSFLEGRSKSLLETLILHLVENAAARHQGAEIQSLLNQLAYFWKHESSRLLEVRSRVGYPQYPVSQKERDPLFLRYRYLERNSPTLRKPLLCSAKL